MVLRPLLSCLLLVLASPLALHAADEAPATPHAALLTWLAEDAAAAEAADQADVAASDRADLAALTAQPLPAPAPGDHTDLLPALAVVDGNPVLKEAIARVDKLVKADRTFLKGPAGGDVRGPEGWVFPTRADELNLLVQAFCHHQSPRSGDARLVVPILRRVASCAEYLVPGGKILGDFGCADNLADAWLVLSTVRPDILPPGLRARMDASIKANATFMYQKWGALFANGAQKYGVVNMDVRRILALAMTHRLFGTPELADIAKTGSAFIANSILADGATHYVAQQNECFSYHIAAVRGLLRLSEIARLPEVREQVVRMRWYYPLSVEPRGIAEWSTAAAWHHYWNMTDGADGALIMAALTGCGHNARIAQGSKPRGDLWQAQWFRTDVKPLPAPDQYIVHDRNVEGPRGRFGIWSWVGTARDFHDDDAKEARGRSTHVGAILQTGGPEAWPLDAALQDVGMAVRTAAKAIPDAEMPWQREVDSLSSRDRNACATGERCAALGATGFLGRYAKPATAWQQRQAWIFTPERLLGLVTVSTPTDATAYDLLGTVLLVSGRGHWGTKRELVQTGPNAWTFGGLAIIVHQRDFTQVEPQITDVMSGSMTHGTQQDGKSLRLLFSDRGLGALEGAATTFPAATRRTLLVEIRPAATAAATTARAVTEGDLLVTELQDGTGTYRLAYNSSDAPAPWTAPGKAGALVHREGEAYRPAWIGEHGKAEHVQPPTPWKAGGLTLPANGLALIEERAKP